MENYCDDLPVFLWSEGLQIRGDVSDPFDPSSGWVTDVWSLLLDAILSRLLELVVVWGLTLKFLRCGSIVGLIWGVQLGFRMVGGEGEWAVVLPPFHYLTLQKL